MSALLQGVSWGVSAGGEVGEEGGRGAELGAGAMVAVVADRPGLGDGSQVPQDVPGGEAVEQFAMLGLVDRVESAGEPLLEQEQVAVDGRQGSAGDQQVADRRSTATESAC